MENITIFQKITVEFDDDSYVFRHSTEEVFFFAKKLCNDVSFFFR